MNEKIAVTVKEILISQLNVSPNDFDWDATLNELHDKFALLDNLVYLEQLLNESFEKKIPILENICTDFHTPNDVINLIKDEL